MAVILQNDQTDNRQNCGDGCISNPPSGLAFIAFDPMRGAFLAVRAGAEFLNLDNIKIGLSREDFGIVFGGFFVLGGGM